MTDQLPSLLKTTQNDSTSIVPGLIRKPFRVQFNNYRKKGLQKGLLDPIRQNTQKTYRAIKKNLKDKLIEHLELDQPEN